MIQGALLIILAVIGSSKEETTKVRAQDIHEFVTYSYQGQATVEAAYARNVYFYYAGCDGLNDLGWGCAWRCLQTCASSYGFHLSIKDLYERFHTDFDEVEKGLKAGAWAEPGYAKKIFKVYKLYLYNRLQGSFKTPTKECSILPTFDSFTKTLFDHFKARHTPIMLDDGSTALNILGIKKTDLDFFILWIADPHKTSKEAGLYYLVLDATGKRIYCTGIDNGKNGIQTARKADPKYGWMLLLP